MSAIPIDLNFAHDYRVRCLDELPSGATRWDVVYIPGTEALGRDGLIVEVAPTGGDRWVGLFAFGNFSSAGVSGLYTLPDPSRLCVMSRGSGYIVRADEPTDWQIVPIDGITDVRPVPEHQIILYADYSWIIAYGPAGLLWKRCGIVGDDLKITDIIGDRIVGGGWDPASQTTVGCELDLLTGLPG